MTGRHSAYNMALVFEHVVERGPDAVALRMGPSDLFTYGQLNALANRIARSLAAEGVGRGDVVGILSEKAPQAYACMIACLKLGAIYTTFDDKIVIQRFTKMLTTSSPRVLFATMDVGPEARSACEERGVRIVDASTGALDALVRDHDDGDIEGTAAVTSEDPAYIMFTSGSTGTPKGAVITHGNLINFRDWTIDRFGTTPADVFSGVNPIFFDNSVFDFYASVFTGASLAPFAGDVVRDPKTLLSQIDERGCTIWFSVPSMLIYLSTMKVLTGDTLSSVRTFVFGGEGYPKSELKKLFDLYGARAKLVNVYGPTECTCICSAYDLGADDFEDVRGLPPLGEIAENFSYLILDGAGAEVASGEVGELCLIGPNVGKGYYKNPEQTARGFSTDPRNHGSGDRMYKTGDLVRWNPEDGYLYFAGRKDNQIKHMGYRIELEEIEAALNTLEYVEESVALYRRTTAKYGQIVAVVGSSQDVEERRVIGDLAPVIPSYMIPNRVVVERELPKNRNGKIDRKELAERYASPRPVPRVSTSAS